MSFWVFTTATSLYQTPFPQSDVVLPSNVILGFYQSNLFAKVIPLYQFDVILPSNVILGFYQSNQFTKVNVMSFFQNNVL